MESVRERRLVLGNIDLNFTREYKFRQKSFSKQAEVTNFMQMPEPSSSFISSGLKVFLRAEAKENASTLPRDTHRCRYTDWGPHCPQRNLMRMNTCEGRGDDRLDQWGETQGYEKEINQPEET